jgi:hypothetical protein
LTIVGKVVTATPKDKIKRPLQPMPDLNSGATYTGWINDVQPGDFVPATWKTTPASPVDKGTYPISMATPASAANYTFSYATGTLTIKDNTPPIARDDQIIRPSGEVVAVPKYKLISNDSDPDGDSVVFDSLVSGLSKNGASIQSDSYWIYYIPVAGANANANDSFTYRVKDQFNGVDMGGIAIATVNIVVRDMSVITIPKNIIDVQPTPEGYRQLTFAGLPGSWYNVQGTVSLTTPNWQTLLSTVSPNPRKASDLGLVVFTDTEAASYPQRFYRLVPTAAPTP